MALRLTTLAVEGGFPVNALQSENSWAYRVLFAVLSSAVALYDQRLEAVLPIVVSYEHLVPAAWRNEATFRLCAELAISILELKTSEGAENPGEVSPTEWLDKHQPSWQLTLPLRVDSPEAGELVGKLLSVAVAAERKEISVVRVLIRDGDRWTSGVRLVLDGFWLPSIKANNMEHIRRASVFPSGALSRYEHRAVGVLEADDQGHWACRQSITNGLLHGVPLEVDCTLEVRTDGVVVNQFVVQGGMALGSGPLVFCLDETDDRHWALVGRVSGKYAAPSVKLALPDLWRARQSAPGELVESCGFLGTMTVWDIQGGCIVTGPDGDESRILCNCSVAETVDLVCIGEPVARLYPSRAGEMAWSGWPSFYIRNNSQLSSAGPRDLVWREVGSRQQWALFENQVGEGYFDVAVLDRANGWVEASERFSVLENPSISARWVNNEVAVDSNIRNLVVRDGAAVTFVDNVGRAFRRRTIDADLQFRWGSQPVGIVVRGSPFIADTFGRPVRREHIMPVADLAKYSICANAGDVLHCELRDRSGRKILGSAFRRPLMGDVSLNCIRRELEGLLDSNADLDGEVALCFEGGDDIRWRVARFGRCLTKRRGRLFPSVEDGTFVGRSMMAPAHEVEFGAVTSTDVRDGFSLPSDLEGPWLVYLRRGPIVTSRPEILGGKPLSSPPSGLAVPTAPFAREVRLKLISEMFELISSGDVGAFELLTEIVALARSLNGLPPATFDVLQETQFNNRILALLALVAKPAERPFVIDLADRLPIAWATIPFRDWSDASELVASRLFEELDGFNSAPSVVGAEISAARSDIVRLEPCLAPVLGLPAEGVRLSAAAQKFLTRSADHLARGQENPFGEVLALLPSWPFDQAYIPVLNAPCAAALAAQGRYRPSSDALRLIRAARGSFPEFFNEAYQAFYRGDTHVI